LLFSDLALAEEPLEEQEGIYTLRRSTRRRISWLGLTNTFSVSLKIVSFYRTPRRSAASSASA